MRKNLIISIVFAFSLLTFTAYARSAEIKVFCDKGKGAVESKVYGGNLLGHYTKWEPCDKFSDYGAGIWDAKWDCPVEEVIKLAQEAGMTVARFPGGCGTHDYDWKKAVGKKRKEFLFGIDEFLKTCQAVGAKPLITVSYFTGGPQDAADLVEYLNTTGGEGKVWANKRVENGHLEPYGVKYFEIGNEVWHGNHRDIKHVAPEEYAKRYLEYYAAMKKIDSSIKIGVVLHTPEWNKVVLEIIKDRVDFGIIHLYPRPVWGKGLETMDPKEIFEVSIGMPVFSYEYSLKEALKLLKKNAGRDVPLAITEYNGGFVQEKPVPYRHSLIAALVNAELLRVFMEPDNHILMANNWNFVNEYWGMITNGFKGDYKDLRKPYMKRPNYYVFEMYAKHFGDILLGSDVLCDGYDVSKYEIFKKVVKENKNGNLGDNVSLSRSWGYDQVDGVEIESSKNDLIINFKDPKQFNYYHASKIAQVKPDTFYKLSGYIKTENLIDDVGVCLEIQDARGWNKTHSAASTEKVKGTTDWQYVEVVYKTLPDAESVRIIARRVGDKGPLKGRAYFKDAALHEFIPSIPSEIPYLSVNASKSSDGDRVYLMVINKNMDEAVTSNIELKDFTPSGDVEYWVLNGPRVDSTNEKNASNVSVKHKSVKIDGPSFSFTFEPHSLTAIEIRRS